MLFKKYSKGVQSLNFFSVALITLITVFGGQAFAQSNMTMPELETYIDGTIEGQIAILDIPAVTVSVVKDNKLIFSKGYGHQNFEADSLVNPQTSLFRIGSVSKLFTWTAIMQLYEQGKIDLDTDVNEYLDFTIPDTFDEPITLKHILTHTAGFEEGAFGYLITYFPDRGPELAQAMEMYLPERVNAPGVVTSYSNYATAIAGLIIQNVSGMPFNDYIDEHIFKPLGMNNSSFAEPLPDELNRNMVGAYDREQGVFKEKPFEVINSFGPAGAVSSSADDMAQFMMAHLNNGELNGKRILQEDTAKLMHSVLFAGDKRLNGMAHGFYQLDYNGESLIAHGGDTMHFHTNLVLNKDKNLGIFVSYMTSTESKGRNAFVQQIYDKYFPVEVKKITPPADFAERAGNYAGNYTFWRRNLSTIEKALAIASGGIDVIPTDDNTLLINGPYGTRQFAEVGEHLFAQVDGAERVAFVANEQGKFDTMYFNSLPFMALGKTPGFESSFAKMILPLICLLLFIHVLIAWFYKRKQYKSASQSYRRLAGTSVLMSVVNLCVAIGLTLVMVVYQDTIFMEIPDALAVVLVLPIVASVLAIITLGFYVKSFADAEVGLASKIYYGFVTTAGLFMLVFYYYWNILGWQYH